MEFNDSFRKIIDNAKSQMTKQSALNIINTHMGCPAKSTKNNRTNKIQYPIKNRTDLIPKEQLEFFKYLFNQKFHSTNMKNKATESFEQFAFRVYNKNKIQTELDLSDLYIEITDLKQLDERLQSCNRINFSSNLFDFKKLDNIFHDSLCSIVLCNCGLDNKFLNYIFKKLCSSNITHINLSSKTIQKKNQLTDPSQLYKLIETSKTLTMLELADIGLNEQNCPNIFQYLRNSNVISIDLSHSNGLIGSGKDIQVAIFRSNKIRTLKGISFKECRFEVLDLSFNRLQVRNMESLFKTQILNIKDLILDENPVGNLDLLEKFLIEKAHIKLLSFKKCSLSFDAIKSLFNGLEMNNHVETVNISLNTLSKQAVKHIAECLRKIKIKTLNMSKCEIWDQQGEQIGKQLIYNKKLKNLNLSHNKLSQLSGSALAMTLRTNRCLLTVNILQNPIPYRYVKEIKESVDFNNFSKKQSIQESKNIHTEDQIILPEPSQVDLQALQRTRIQLTRDIEKLSLQNTKLLDNKQTFQQLEQVFNFLDNQGTQKINKLMDELDEIQVKINQQKQMKIEIIRKSLSQSSN